MPLDFLQEAIYTFTTGHSHCYSTSYCAFQIHAQDKQCFVLIVTSNFPSTLLARLSTSSIVFHATHVTTQQEIPKILIKS